MSRYAEGTANKNPYRVRVLRDCRGGAMGDDMSALINRIFAMPSRHTFTIKPIRELLSKYINDSNRSAWADPFCGWNSPAGHRNDLNPNVPAESHLKGNEFMKGFPDGSLDGVLFDPPYSPRQISECYKKVGFDVHMADTQASFYSSVKNVIATKIRLGGFAISFGWNSMGMGLQRGFKQIEILLVAHGGAHNDTIVVVEKKTRTPQQLEMI